eukprot:CAMPEP_0115750638 /NCGR_PEP_ID=MMETSP0272-20121206/94839_1 /TAXON_ID=71861 /ORGANISM="Scrippsiella trochoidea, Strain CCMP3099" /LENGTH=70 /DNA_ID=CAMNT_0003195783 /DNA_START=95 /DNA_END=305 /DNA_ORIENTATION=+
MAKAQPGEFEIACYKPKVVGVVLAMPQYATPQPAAPAARPMLPRARQYRPPSAWGMAVGGGTATGAAGDE